MTVHYSETFHRVKCDCGESFFVAMGNVAINGQPPISHISVKCPGCSRLDWLHSRQCKAVRREMRLSEHEREAELLHCDADKVVVSVPELVKTVSVLRNHRNLLRASIRSAIIAWDSVWNRTVMPSEFCALLRAWKETKHDESIDIF